MLVSQFVEAALDAEVALPEGAVGGAAGHGAEEEGVDLDDLLDGLRRDVGAHRRPRVDGDDDALVELEGEGRGPLGELHELVTVRAVAHAEVRLRVGRRVLDAGQGEVTRRVFLIDLLVAGLVPFVQPQLRTEVQDTVEAPSNLLQ